MEEFHEAPGLREWIAARRREGRRIGLVPTMGALHDGHLSLVDAARRRTDAIVMSIFVNPLQFGPGEDFHRYPREPARDRKLAAARGVDALFVPTTEAMYPPGAEVRIAPGPSASRWEGECRPGHFTGVLTVVAKLFNLVGPDMAVFGQKDFQQAVLIRRMVRDLDFNLELVVAPTVREEDGLAMSSRNAYLSPEERARALALSRGLRAACDAFRAGERSASALERTVRAALETAAVPADYVAVVDDERLEVRPTADADTIVAVAARVGSTRLIDNVILGRGMD